MGLESVRPSHEGGTRPQEWLAAPERESRHEFQPGCPKLDEFLDGDRASRWTFLGWVALAYRSRPLALRGPARDSGDPRNGRATGPCPHWRQVKPCPEAGARPLSVDSKLGPSGCLDRSQWRPSRPLPRILGKESGFDFRADAGAAFVDLGRHERLDRDDPASVRPPELMIRNSLQRTSPFALSLSLRGVCALGRTNKRRATQGAYSAPFLATTPG
jgi:hypothetical protein